MPDDSVAYRFLPADEGQHVIGIPARDLLASEVEEIKAREPAAFRTATAPHPASGRVLYQPVKPSGKRADQPDAPAKE